MGYPSWLLPSVGQQGPVRYRPYTVVFGTFLLNLTVLPQTVGYSALTQPLPTNVHRSYTVDHCVIPA